MLLAYNWRIMKPFYGLNLLWHVVKIISRHFFFVVGTNWILILVLFLLWVVCMIQECCKTSVSPVLCLTFRAFILKILSRSAVTYSGFLDTDWRSVNSREMECQCEKDNSEDAVTGQLEFWKLIKHTFKHIKDVCTTSQRIYKVLFILDLMRCSGGFYIITLCLHGCKNQTIVRCGRCCMLNTEDVV